MDQNCKNGSAKIVLYCPQFDCRSSGAPAGEERRPAPALRKVEEWIPHLSRPVRLLAPRTLSEAAEQVRNETKNAAYFLELPPHRPGAVVLKRKGMRRYEVQITGVRSPVGQPQLEQNVLSRAAQLINAYSAISRQHCVGTSFVSYGLTCDGEAPEILPDRCRFTAEIYGETLSQLNGLCDAFCAAVGDDRIYGTEGKAELILDLPPFVPQERDFALFDLLRTVTKGAVPAGEFSRVPDVTGIAAANGAACLGGLTDPETVKRLIEVLPDEGLTASPLRFAAPLTDRCLLQRDQPIRLWGDALPNAELTVTLGDETVRTRSDASGAWQAEFSPRPASLIPVTASVSDGVREQFIEDILIGDLWILGGQSNMEHSLCHNPQVTALSYADRKAASPDLPVRTLTQRRIDSLEDPQSMQTPQKRFRNPVRSQWRKPGEAELEEVSTIGWYFADKVCRALDRTVPVGILSVCAGSSALLHLMPQPQASREDFMRNANVENLSVPPAGIYNTMTAPVLGLRAKGMLFYQGESDQVRWEDYDRLSAEFAARARADFGEDLYFFYAQISSHCVWDRINEIREKQTAALNRIPGSALVVTRDRGWKPGDMERAHPNYKKDVGLRFADLALALVYGKADPDYSMAPVPADVSFGRDGATVRFAHVGDGLRSAGETVCGFEICRNGAWAPAQAQITGKDTVFVPGADAEGVRFAHFNLADTDAADLCSSTGYQAAAFEEKRTN